MPNPMYAHYSSDDLYDPAKRAEAIAQVESELGRRVPADTGGKSVATVLGAVVHPQVADGIISEAGDRAVDAVVMGSHGHGALFHLPMGSVAEAVFRQARMPVLIVPGQG
jgi:nucleotide-binding universal stress UspA family protein